MRTLQHVSHPPYLKLTSSSILTYLFFLFNILIGCPTRAALDRKLIYGGGTQQGARYPYLCSSAALEYNFFSSFLTLPYGRPHHVNWQINIPSSSETRGAYTLSISDALEYFHVNVFF